MAGPETLHIFFVIGLCYFFYILGAWQRSGVGKGDSIALAITRSNTDCDVATNLNFETHHGGEMESIDESDASLRFFESCKAQYTDYTLCQDQKRAMTFPRENMNYCERHCLPDEEKLHCLIPALNGYVTLYPWLKSRDYVPYANAPYKALTVEKAIQNRIQYEGNILDSLVEEHNFLKELIRTSTSSLLWYPLITGRSGQHLILDVGLRVWEHTFGAGRLLPCPLHQETHMKRKCNSLLKEVCLLLLASLTRLRCLILPRLSIWLTVLGA